MSSHIFRAWFYCKYPVLYDRCVVVLCKCSAHFQKMLSYRDDSASSSKRRHPVLKFDVSHSHSWLKTEKVIILLLFLIICQRFCSGSSLFAGCTTEWDDIRCWPRAEVGQVANASCAEVFQHFSSNQGWFPFRASSPNTSFFPSAPTDDHTEVASSAAQLLVCLCCVICNRNASWSQPD